MSIGGSRGRASALSGVPPSLTSSLAVAPKFHGAHLTLLVNSVSHYWSSRVRTTNSPVLGTIPANTPS